MRSALAASKHAHLLVRLLTIPGLFLLLEKWLTLQAVYKGLYLLVMMGAAVSVRISSEDFCASPKDWRLERLTICLAGKIKLS